MLIIHLFVYVKGAAGMANTVDLDGIPGTAGNLADEYTLICRVIYIGEARNFIPVPGQVQTGLPVGILCGEKPSGKDRKSTRLNSSHVAISYAVFCLKKKKTYARQYDSDSRL